MTPEREKLIRDHWRMTRGWPTEGEVLCVPVRRPMPYNDVAQGADIPVSATIETLEFKREYGTLYGRKAMRVTCEGVVLETVVE